MDHFGIGCALQGAAEIYFRASRSTGRTKSLLDSVVNGDRVVFVDYKQADQFMRRCRDRKVEVKALVCDPADVTPLYTQGSKYSDGRLLFDHVWVEQYYRSVLRRAAQEIDDMQAKLSGSGATSTDTLMAKNSRYRWDFC